MTISQTIRSFVRLAIDKGYQHSMDDIYLQNRVIALIGEKQLLGEYDSTASSKTLLDVLDELVAYAVESGNIANETVDKDILSTQLMDIITPLPSVVNRRFQELYQNNPEDATNYFYQLSQENDYIKTRAIMKNIAFKTQTEYGTLDITINLSKPEKDPKQIAAALTMEKVNYPKCLLCIENEGYLGGIHHPTRANHRLIRCQLLNEEWGFQYSPYAYYNEHAIVLSTKHRPMIINQKTFERLLAFTDVFPHYFIGSNADLPIVGGSILTHDHYQAGKYVFPMAVAPTHDAFTFAQYPKVSGSIVKWPMSVIRLQSTSFNQLTEAANMVLQKWKHYSDEKVQVTAVTDDGVQHHTVTPIARKKENIYELDLVLRDNNVSAEYPDGIFHPHADVQHIKKENIGLIEVMGLAILPPRLDKELKEVEKYLLDQDNVIADCHLEWAKRLKHSENVTQENVQCVVQEAVGKVFLRVLEDAGVFKRNEEGQRAFKKFIDYVVG